MNDGQNQFDGDLSVRPLETIDDLIGNDEAMRRAVRIVRWNGAPPRMALFGPPGSGKSTTINYACALAHCHHPNGDVPCNLCNGCKAFKVGHPHTG